MLSSSQGKIHKAHRCAVLSELPCQKLAILLIGNVSNNNNNNNNNNNDNINNNSNNNTDKIIITTTTTIIIRRILLNINYNSEKLMIQQCTLSKINAI